MFEIKATGPSTAYIFKANSCIHSTICDKQRAPFSASKTINELQSIFYTGGSVGLIQNCSKIYCEGVQVSVHKTCILFS